MEQDEETSTPWIQIMSGLFKQTFYTNFCVRNGCKTQNGSLGWGFRRTWPYSTVIIRAVMLCWSYWPWDMQRACKENTVFPQTMTRKHGLSTVNSHRKNAKETSCWIYLSHEPSASTKQFHHMRARTAFHLLNVTVMSRTVSFKESLWPDGRNLHGGHIQK